MSESATKTRYANRAVIMVTITKVIGMVALVAFVAAFRILPAILFLAAAVFVTSRLREPV